MLLAIRSEGGLKDKSADLVPSLKLGPPLLLFLNSKIQRYMFTLDVGMVSFEYMCMHTCVNVCMNACMCVQGYVSMCA